MAAQVSHIQTKQAGRFAARRNNRNRNQRKASSANGTPVVTPPDGNKLDKPEDEGTEADVANADDEDKDDSDVCWICAEPVKFYSLSECNHRTCHVCALRLRALYKKMDCTFCKHPQEMVIFTTSPTSQYQEYNLLDMTYKDSKLSIVFETQEMMEETLIILRFNCPYEDCSFIGKGWNDLKAHVRGVHGKQLCDLCIRLKKVFAHEHALYTMAQLQVHLPSLRQRVKPFEREKDVPEGGIHPLCEFCKDCFFGDDELFSHMRERHEDCFICKRQGIRDKYFRDYGSLELHFNHDHFPCTQTACQAQKFVVFGSLLDLKAHMVEEHGSSMSTRDIKEARRLETNFEFDDARGSGRRRERDRNEAEIPPPAMQARFVDRRRDGFGAALTGQAGQGSSTPANLRSGRNSPSLAEDADPEFVRRYAAFMTRVANITSNSSSLDSSVRSAVRSFRASESGARDVISIFYSIVDRDLEATASLIVPLVDLIDDEGKKKELLEAFNGFKIDQRRQFPDLVSGGQDAAYAGVASGRVLNAKHSTQSRRNAGQVWDRVARAATSSPSIPGSSGPSLRAQDRFPALPRVAPAVATSSSATPAFRQPQRSTPWASSASVAAQPVVAPLIVFSETKVKKASPSQAVDLSSSAFPSLPTTSPRVMVPTSGNKSLRNIIGNAGPAGNAWNSNGKNSTQVQTTEGNAEEVPVEPPSQQRKGRKKGKEKVTLFTLGAFPT